MNLILNLIGLAHSKYRKKNKSNNNNPTIPTITSFFHQSNRIISLSILEIFDIYSINIPPMHLFITFRDRKQSRAFMKSYPQSILKYPIQLGLGRFGFRIPSILFIAFYHKFIDRHLMTLFGAWKLFNIIFFCWINWMYTSGACTILHNPNYTKSCQIFIWICLLFLFLFFHTLCFLIDRLLVEASKNRLKTIQRIWESKNN